jgi:hypothetical protein
MIMKSLNPWCRTAQLSNIFAVVVLASACVARAQGQIPSAMFQNSTLTGSGNTMTATRVPVRISSSLTIYLDVTVKFDVDSNGNLTVSAGQPQILPSATLLTGNFKAGTYVGPSSVANGKAIITVGGPGVSDGGATAWSLSAAAGADSCTFPPSATWYVGPISNSPLQARLKSQGITSTAWSYGVSGQACTGFPNYTYWAAGTLIGVSQTGNAVTIASFSKYGNLDYSAPVDQVTFTLVP